MLKHLLAVSSFFFLLILFAFTQDKPSSPASTPPAYTIPDAAVHQANPVPATSESLAIGKKWYALDCAMCHGATGDGKGGVAADMKTKVADFANPATLKARTDGELFYIIKNGKGDMPGEGTRVTSNELWSVVNYIRTFSKSKDKTGKPSAEEKPAAEKTQ